MPKVSERGKLMPDRLFENWHHWQKKAKARGVKVYHLNIGQPDLEIAASSARRSSHYRP